MFYSCTLHHILNIFLLLCFYDWIFLHNKWLNWCFHSIKIGKIHFIWVAKAYNWFLEVASISSRELFIFISNKIIIDIKKGHPRIQGSNNQLHKLHKSIKLTTKNKVWLCPADNQSNRVLKKYNLRSGIILSVSSKLLLFLSLQRHHIKQ